MKLKNLLLSKEIDFALVLLALATGTYFVAAGDKQVFIFSYTILPILAIWLCLQPLFSMLERNLRLDMDSSSACTSTIYYVFSIFFIVLGLLEAVGNVGQSGCLVQTDYATFRYLQPIFTATVSLGVSVMLVNFMFGLRMVQALDDGIYLGRTDWHKTVYSEEKDKRGFEARLRTMVAGAFFLLSGTLSAATLPVTAIPSSIATIFEPQSWSVTKPFFYPQNCYEYLGALEGMGPTAVLDRRRELSQILGALGLFAVITYILLLWWIIFNLRSIKQKVAFKINENLDIVLHIVGAGIGGVISFIFAGIYGFGFGIENSWLLKSYIDQRSALIWSTILGGFSLSSFLFMVVILFRNEQVRDV
ncbi:MAG: hypothetical protein AAF950_08170 [Pseudomonadota bacterium]